MGNIRIGIVGVGNCASALIQGLHYYASPDRPCSGLMSPELGGYGAGDIEAVCAFDVDRRKVGQDLSSALFAPPNCTRIFCGPLPASGVTVRMGRALDGYTPPVGSEDPGAGIELCADEQPSQAEVARTLRDARCQIVLNYLPVGSEQASRFYAEAALEAGCGFVNCMPVFLASDAEWGRRFAARRLPIVGDDVKSQLGATILHRALGELCRMRGIKVRRTYQLNVGGNTDFLNMLDQSRLVSKRRSKTAAVQSQLGEPLCDEDIRIGPSDYVPWLKDNKICFIRVEGAGFGDSDIEIDVRMSVQDSSNSAGCVIDAIRCCRMALDRGIGGPLISASAFLMKHPPQQFPDHEAERMLQEFAARKRDC